MNDDYKDLALELAFKEIRFLRGELEAVDGRLRRVDKERYTAQSRLNELRTAVLQARVLRETTDVKDFRVHLVEKDWDRIDTLAKDPT